MPSPTAAEWKALEKCESFNLTYIGKEKKKKGIPHVELCSLYLLVQLHSCFLQRGPSVRAPFAWSCIRNLIACHLRIGLWIHIGKLEL